MRHSRISQTLDSIQARSSSHQLTADGVYATPCSELGAPHCSGFRRRSRRLTPHNREPTCGHFRRQARVFVLVEHAQKLGAIPAENLLHLWRCAQWELGEQAQRTAHHHNTLPKRRVVELATRGGIGATCASVGVAFAGPTETALPQHTWMSTLLGTSQGNPHRPAHPPERGYAVRSTALYLPRVLRRLLGCHG
jgi:hypothetical protein